MLIIETNYSKKIGLPGYIPSPGLQCAAYSHFAKRREWS